MRASAPAVGSSSWRAVQETILHAKRSEVAPDNECRTNRSQSCRVERRFMMMLVLAQLMDADGRRY